MTHRNARPDYEIQKRNRFFEANRRLVEYEMRPANTVTFFATVDLGEIEQIRQNAHECKPSYTALVAKALALALRQFPYANRRVCRRLWVPWGRPRLQAFKRCDVAIAVERDVSGAESVAFIDILRDADERSLTEITEWLRTLADCDANTNKQWRDFQWVITRLPQWLSTLILRLPYLFPRLWVKYRGGPVLISSPAKYGVDGVVATWSWPLGVSFGLVKDRPIVRDCQIVACPTFYLIFNFDRRIMAGAQAARFFKCILDSLERAETTMAPFLSYSQDKIV